MSKDDIAGDRKTLWDLTVGSLRRDARSRRVLTIVSTLGIASTIAGLSLFRDYFDPNVAFVSDGLRAGLIVFSIIIGLILLFTDKNGPEALKEAHEQAEHADRVLDNLRHVEARLEEAREQLARLALLYVTSGSLLEIAQGVLAQDAVDDRARKAILSRMLDTLLSDKGRLFGINDERWNFAIYTLDAPTNKLTCQACRRRDRADEEGEHRSWEPGNGHIGRAFLEKREFIVDDVQEPRFRDHFRALDGLHRDDDADRYRSFAAIPVRLSGAPPVGVIIATSDVPQRFGPSETLPPNAVNAVEPLRAFASILAIVIARPTVPIGQSGG